MAEDSQGKEPLDPLDLAADLLFQVVGGLEEAVTDFKKNEASRTMLMIAQTTALIDMARSMRAQTDNLGEIREHLHRMRVLAEYG